MPFFHNEPAENWDAKVRMTLSKTASTKEGFDTKSSSSFLSDSIRNSIRNGGLMEFMKHSARPTELHTMYDIYVNEYKQKLQCFMWQQSVFYTLAYFGSHAWNLRWFTITPENISSIPDRQDAENGRMSYPKFAEIFVDEKRLIISIPNPHEGQRDFVLMAPSKEIFDKVVTWFDKYMVNTKNNALGTSTMIDVSDELYEPGFEDADNHESLIEFPSDGSAAEMLFWFLLFPLRFAMHYTLPDVRQLDSHGEMKIRSSKRIMHAFGSTFMCLMWLIIGR
jgi:hypothetical protein